MRFLNFKAKHSEENEKSLKEEETDIFPRVIST